MYTHIPPNLGTIRLLSLSSFFTTIPFFLPAPPEVNTILCKTKWNFIYINVRFCIRFYKLNSTSFFFFLKHVYGETADLQVLAGQLKLTVVRLPLEASLLFLHINRNVLPGLRGSGCALLYSGCLYPEYHNLILLFPGTQLSSRCPRLRG